MLSNSVFQSDLWSKFQASLPGRSSGKVGSVYWTILPSSYRQCYLYLNRPQHKADLLKYWPAIVTLARQKKCMYIKIEPNWPKDDGHDLAELKLKKVALHIQPSTTLYLDLQVDTAEILKQMKPKGRYNIKIAAKHAIEYKSFSYGDPALEPALETFYKILKTTAQRDHFGIHPYAYYQQFLQALHPHSVLYMAYYQNEPIAGLIALFHDQEAIYYYGASDSEKRNTMATYGLQWQVIQDAQKKGMKVYDFLGIADPNSGPEHPWHGVTEFKQKFGGKVYEYAGTFHYVLAPIKHFIFCTLKQVHYERKKKHSKHR